jgi:hypothetical protein
MMHHTVRTQYLDGSKRPKPALQHEALVQVTGWVAYAILTCKLVTLKTKCASNKAAAP